VRNARGSTMALGFEKFLEEFDFFISHASADKADFVRPLATALINAGYSVWYDDLSIKPGESIRRSIDSGIAKSRAGLIVMSRSFFARPWPQAELDALLALHIGQKKRIIPIWLGLEHEDVALVSPLIADKKAIKGPAPLDEIVGLILETLPIAPVSDLEVEAVITANASQALAGQEYLLQQALSRLCAIVQIANEYWNALQAGGEDEDEDAFEERMSAWWALIRARFSIPAATNFGEPQPVPDKTLRWALRTLKAWSRGTLDWQDAAAFYFWLDEAIDADYLYIFFGIPLARATFEQRDKLHQAIIDIGVRNSSRKQAVDFREAFDHAFHEWYESLAAQKQ
jgi:hypothetical protein